MDLKNYRKELKDFTKWKNVKKSLKPYQTKAKELLALSDDELLKWIEANNAPYFAGYATNLIIQKEDAAKYKRLQRKAEDWDFEEFTESEQEFIEFYEAEHGITESLLDI